MLSRNLTFALRLSPHRPIIQVFAKNSTAAANADVTDDKDPAPYFFNEEVQKLLKTLTRPEPDKVFRRRLDGRELEPPEYKFMTDEQLEKAMYKANIEMLQLLQMPPVVKTRKENVKIYSKDPALQGLYDHKHVFTDITYGVKNKDRIIAVREPDGTLRSATWEERDRLNQIYNPLKGREIRVPKMFEDEHLQPILDRGDYEFILNRACVQFDPDHPSYHRVTQATYERINQEMHFDKLRSTRHYGPMVFYLAWNKQIDNLLLENIKTNRIEDAALAIRLFYILNPSDKTVKEKDDIKLIQSFIENEAGNKRKLDQTLKMYLELEAEKRIIQENVGKAHGRKGEETTKK